MAGKRAKKSTSKGKNKKKKNLWRGNRMRVPGALIALMSLAAAAVAALGLLLALAAPPKAEAALAQGLVLNELMSDSATVLPDGSGAADWIELRNAGSSPLELKGYMLMLGTQVNRTFSFPEAVLEPGACALVYCSGADAAGGGWNAPFRLPASGGQELRLLSPAGERIDGVSLPELSAGEAYARNADGVWERRSRATPGADNAAARSGESSFQAGDVELSEISTRNTLYFPDEDGTRHDYVELHNISGADVNLAGWLLSDDDARLARWAFPAVTIPAGGYLAVHCSGLDRRDDPSHLHASFRLGEGETVYLCRPDGAPVSAVTPPALEADQAWSLVDGSWSKQLAPTPGAENSAEAAAQVNEAHFGGAAVRLNELMARADAEPFDWIELYNASAQAVDLSGYGLSDRSDRPRKWQFPEGTVLEPGAYLAVALTGSGSAADSSSYPSADFALDAAGGSTVTLSNPAGKVLDAVYLPKQYGGMSYGRAEGGSGFYYYEAGTPQAANAGTYYRSRAPQVRASVRGGLFAAGQSFEVELDVPAGCRAYYTLDSSDPDESATPYTEPIPVSDTTVLRTRTYRDGDLPSLIDTQSYLYGVDNEVRGYVVSLVTDEDNLTGEDGLAYGDNLTRDLEREAHIEIFTPEGERVISQGCDISLHGYSSRLQAIKSINVIASGDYGENRFNYPLFSQRDYDSYKSILLRPSGEDQRMSFMRDSVLTSLMRGSSLMFQETEICIEYINGEFYSLCYLRERINKHSICQFEGWEGMEDDIDIGLGNDEVRQGSDASYQELVEWAGSADMSTDEAFAHLDACIDVQNYIEYMAAEIFVGNEDLLNVRRYRNAKADGKWRWALYDLDWGFYSDINSFRRWLEPGGTGAQKATDNTLFIACMDNPTFRDRLLRYLGEQLAGNFSSEYVVEQFRLRYERIEPILDAMREKWGYTFNESIADVVNYAQTRPQKLIGYCTETLELSDDEVQDYFGAALEKIREYEEGNS